jgi:hypothetical protein
MVPARRCSLCWAYSVYRLLKSARAAKMQVSKLLSGSGLLLKAQVILAAAEALWKDIQPVVSAAKQQGLCPAEMFSRANINWAVGICLSRSVRLDDRGGVVVLCPFADLFNHSCDSKAFLLWDKQQQAVVLQADKAYKPGDEVSRACCLRSAAETRKGSPCTTCMAYCWAVPGEVQLSCVGSMELSQ